MRCGTRRGSLEQICRSPHQRSRQTSRRRTSEPRFRTIQARPKDLPVPSGATSACGKGTAGSAGGAMRDIRRREFMMLVGGALAWPAVARAEQGPVRIGVLPLGSQSNAYDMSLVEALRSGLRQVGLIENRDVVLDVRWITGDPNQTVAEVIQRGADMLIPCGTNAALAAK